MLTFLEIPAQETERGVIIWLHGLGADSGDLEPVAQMLNLPQLRHILPDAPVRPVTVVGGMAMRAWYDIAGANISAGPEDSAGMIASADAVAELAAGKVAPETPLLVIGFSQGGVIALILGLKRLARTMGIGVLSAYMPQFLKNEPWYRPALFMAHGAGDTVILPEWGRASRQWLEQGGCSVTWREYPMAHAICQQEIEDLVLWIQATLDW